MDASTWNPAARSTFYDSCLRIHIQTLILLSFTTLLTVMSTLEIIAGCNFRPGRRAELERGRPYVFETLVKGDSDHTRLTLRELRGQGRSYDVYSAVLGDASNHRNVVVKVCDPWLAAGDQQLEHGDEEVHVDRESSMKREAELYATTLKCLQGRTVPVFHGLWRGTCPSKSDYRPDFELLVMVVEDVGDSLQAKVRDWEQATEYK